MKMVQCSGKDIMDRLEQTFLETVAAERLEVSRSFNWRMEDRFKRTKKILEWTKFGWDWAAAQWA
jgi:hypothetical protein